MAHMAKEDLVKMQIKRIEKEIRDTPYHKGTEHYIGRLRAKLSKLKDAVESKSTKKSGRKGYAVKKQGDATVTLVGPPSVGKSTLINKLTNAKSKIAPYAFTTVTVIPGMMDYHDAKIQILDVPGLIEGAESGKGRGKEVLSVVRGSELLLIMCDVNNTDSFEWITESLEENGIRVNKKKPDVVIEKKLKGGIQVITNYKQSFSKETVKEIAKEFRIANAEITIKEKLSIDRLIDAFNPNRVYIPAIYVINKVDMKKGSYKNTIMISAEKGTGLDKLKEEMWHQLGLVRIFLVKRGEEPSENNPIIVLKETSLKKVADKIGEEFAEGKTRAKIWGSVAKFPGQEVSLSKKVSEGMQIRFV